nr:hypothetical protein CFP56_27878 [Quercus suber]
MREHSRKKEEGAATIHLLSPWHISRNNNQDLLSEDRVTLSQILAASLTAQAWDPPTPQVQASSVPTTQQATLVFTTPPRGHEGCQYTTVVENRYLATKNKLDELAKDNEDLLKKILDMMNKVSKSKKLHSEAKENTKAITKRKEALEKGLQEIKKKLEDKASKLEAFVVVDNEKI